MTETWRPVVGYEELYEVSNIGRVRSLTRISMKRNRWGEFPHTYVGAMLNPDTSSRYLRLKLSKDGKIRRVLVHALVAEAFIGPRPAGMQVCHHDGDPLNNHVDNLRYDTPSANMRDTVRHGTHAETRKTHCPQGHPYDEVNTWHATARNQRLCRACNRQRQRELRKEVAA